MGRNELIAKFEEVYGSGGEIRVFFAPGRVNLIGEHTDYNGGHVFPCALTVGTFGAVRVRSDRKLRFASLNVRMGEIRESSLDDLEYHKESGWINYPKGVLWAYESAGHSIPNGLDVLYYGEIPSGAGLSSSASLEVLTGLMVRELFGIEVSMIEIAQLSQKAECEFVGVRCGIMDQFTSAMGRKDQAIFLAAETLKYQYVPLKLDGIRLVVTNSKIRHKLAASEYNKRYEECARALRKLQVVSNIHCLGDLDTDHFEDYKDVIMDPVLIRRTRHVVYENARTIRAVNALRLHKAEKFGLLMNESHDSLRDDYEVSCPEIDFLVDRAREVSGVLGSRITGGGFGGCTISLVREEALEPFREHLTAMYRQRYEMTPEFYVVESGDGAHEVR